MQAAPPPMQAAPPPPTSKAQLAARELQARLLVAEAARDHHQTHVDAHWTRAAGYAQQAAHAETEVEARAHKDAHHTHLTFTSPIVTFRSEM